MASEDPLAFLGQVSTSDEVDGPVVFAAVWRPVTDLIPDVGAFVDPDPEGDPWPPLPAHDLLCWWGHMTGTEELLDATAHLTGWMHAMHGCTPTDVLLMLHALTARVARQVGDELYGPERLWRYGFVCARWPQPEEFDALCAAAAEMGLPGAAEVTHETLDSAAALVQTNPEALSLDTPLTTRPIVNLGEWYAYDALSYSGLFQGLVADAQADPASEGRARRRLETQTHARLAALGPQPWKQGKRIRHRGKDVTDLDASVVVDDLLVVVDCYSSNWTAALDRGDHAATRNRAQHLRAKLDAWDSTWRRIAAGEGIDSLRPDIEKVVRVLPVVVTASPEWVDHDQTDDPALWFDASVPRVLTVDELAALLTITDSDSLPHTIPLR